MSQDLIDLQAWRAARERPAQPTQPATIQIDLVDTRVEEVALLTRRNDGTGPDAAILVEQPNRAMTIPAGVEYARSLLATAIRGSCRDCLVGEGWCGRHQHPDLEGLVQETLQGLVGLSLGSAPCRS